MSRKTHPDKRSTARKAAARHSTGLVRFNRPTKTISCIVLASLIVGVTYASWLPSKSNGRATNSTEFSQNETASPVKNVSTLSTSELEDIPPEALYHRPLQRAGYNASQGGLPPGALPPGVVLPGITQPLAPPQGYGMYDGVRQQFTGQERDNETGLDYFHARYYSATQGRFTSVDPANAGADPSNPQSWNGYAYALNNPVKYRDPDGLKVRVCDTSGNCTDDKTDLTDDQWNKWFGGDKSIKLHKGNIYKGGELIGTYQQQSCDSCLYDIFSMGRQITASDPGGKAVKLWAGSVVAGVSGGTAYYFAAPFLAPTVTTLALRSAPLLPVVPSAIDKLQKLGISPERASAIVQSPASQKLIDNANNGNINHVQEVGGNLIRITTDPSGQRIISAGMMRANQITNGIARGRYTPKK